jgi:hypothetical protein
LFIFIGAHKQRQSNIQTMRRIRNETIPLAKEDFEEAYNAMAKARTESIDSHPVVLYRPPDTEFIL